MQLLYEHKQYGQVMLVILLFPIIGLVFAVALTPGSAPFLLLFLILLFMLFTAVIFGSLTVKVDARQVQFYFGLHLFGRSIPLEKITGVQVVRNGIWMGLGIHFIKRGLIYNVSGLDGVEISLENGRRIRIGTDEPAALAQAIEVARRHQVGQASP